MQRFCKTVCLFLACLPFLLNHGGLPGSLLLPQNWSAIGLILVVAWLLRSVRTAALRVTPRGLLYFALYSITLPAAILRHSNWLAAVAFCLSVLLLSEAAGLRLRGRLLFLLVLFTGLPASIAVPLRTAADERLIQHASALAGSLGFLHFRDSTVAGSLTATTDLQQILNSPFGVSGFTVLISCLLLYRRRTLAQVLLMLPAAVVTSLLGQFCCCLLAILQLSTVGLRLPAGIWPVLLCFPLVFTVLTLQGGVLFLTSGVISDDGKTTVKARTNPANRLWGLYVSGDLPQKWSAVSFRTSDGQKLSLFACFMAFFRDWGISRKVSYLYRALPGTALLVVGLLAENAGASAMLTVNSRYENLLAVAREKGDRDSEELCLRALAGLQSGNLLYRMRLAEFLWQHRSHEAGWAEILRLADDGQTGFADAHLWIVRNALSAEPYQQLTAEQMIDRLNRAIRSAPDTAEAHGLLAQLYPAIGEKLLGEQHLIRAAEADLTYVDALAASLAAEGRLQPGDSRVRRRCEMLLTQLNTAPRNNELRIQLAVLLMLTGRDREAEQLLDQGLQLDDSLELRRAAADLQLRSVSQELISARLQGDHSMLAVRRALQLDPQNPLAPMLASFLHLQGASFAGFSEPAMQYWDTCAAELPADDSQSPESAGRADAVLRNKAHLAFALNKDEDCLTTFARLGQLQPQDVKVRVAALQSVGRTADAEAAARALADQLRQSTRAEDRASAADVLCQAKLFEEAKNCLQLEPDSEQAKLILAGAQASTALEHFDHLTGYPGDYSLQEADWVPQVQGNSARQLAGLLQQGLLVREFSMRAADRLYRMSLQPGAIGKVADTALDQLRAQGVAADDVLAALGSRALQAGRIEPAIRWLRMAETSADGRDPALLNNLALALVRSNDRQLLPEALKLAGRAVQIAPDNHYMLTTRAEIQLALGDVRAAVSDLELARQVRPDFPETLQLLAKASIQQGNMQRAEQYLQEAAQLQKTQP